MKTISSGTLNAIRITERVLSAILVGFALFMFIGESMESAKKTNQEPISLHTILQLGLFGTGLLGLALALKWELFGGILSLLAFIMIFIVNPNALVWMMFIFPAVAILFIVVGYLNRESL
jgi:hypothetical protein